ncbi:MAG: HEAT repeat domain-containing protein [Myxococcota bacterium]
MRLPHLLAIVLIALSSSACAGLSSTGHARRGEHIAMRRAMLEDFRQGRLSPDAVAELAAVVAERELTQATGTAAVQRVQQVRLCARALDDALSERAERDDEAAPLAAMALLLVDRGEPEAWREHLDSDDPAWRAVAVRTLTEREHGPERRKAMLDLDERVRLAAVQASERAMDPADRVVLLDTARNDPDRLVRVTAVRALGWVATEQDVLAMRDLWSRAPLPVRQAIVAAWSFPGTLERGGQRELLWVAETQAGTPMVIAGGILVRLGKPTRGTGLAALRRAMQEGIARDRAMAIAMVPLDEPGFRELVGELAKEAEPAVRVAALAKLATDPKAGAEARKELGALAVSERPGADKARAAMARIGDDRVTKLLLKQAKSADERERREALAGFLALEDYARAAFFMADPDAGLRTRAACEILAASARW